MQIFRRENRRCTAGCRGDGGQTKVVAFHSYPPFAMLYCQGARSLAGICCYPTMEEKCCI